MSTHIHTQFDSTRTYTHACQHIHTYIHTLIGVSCCKNTLLSSHTYTPTLVGVLCCKKRAHVNIHTHFHSTYTHFDEGFVLQKLTLVNTYIHTHIRLSRSGAFLNTSLYIYIYTCFHARLNTINLYTHTHTCIHDTYAAINVATALGPGARRKPGYAFLQIFMCVYVSWCGTYNSKREKHTHVHQGVCPRSLQGQVI